MSFVLDGKTVKESIITFSPLLSQILYINCFPLWQSKIILILILILTLTPMSHTPCSWSLGFWMSSPCLLKTMDLVFASSQSFWTNAPKKKTSLFIIMFAFIIKFTTESMNGGNWTLLGSSTTFKSVETNAVFWSYCSCCTWYVVKWRRESFGQEQSQKYSSVFHVAYQIYLEECLSIWCYVVKDKFTGVMCLTQYILSFIKYSYSVIGVTYLRAYVEVSVFKMQWLQCNVFL